MFNLCKMYKKHVAPKMYPTWEQSDRGELNMIAKRYIKIFHKNIFTKPYVGSKMKAQDVLQPPSLKRRNIATILVPKM